MTNASSSALWRQLTGHMTAPSFAAASSRLNRRWQFWASQRIRSPCPTPSGRQGVGETVGSVVELCVAVAVRTADARECVVCAACCASTSAMVTWWSRSGPPGRAAGHGCHARVSRVHDPRRLVAGAREGLAVEHLDARLDAKSV